MTTFPFKLKSLRRKSQPKRRPGLEAVYKGLVARLVANAASSSLAQVVGMTACSAGEGVTTVISNLAAAAGRSLDQPTLLVDANVDDPVLRERFGLEEAPGLSEVLSGRRPLDECIQPTQVPRLAVLGPGLDSISTGFFRPETWQHVVESVRQPYGLVLVDLPPASKLVSQFAVAESLDGLLLLIRAEHTRTKAAQRYREQLARINPRILGVVLNRRRTYVPDWLYQRI